MGWESISSLVEGRRTENGFFKGTYLDGKRDCYRADYAGIVAVNRGFSNDDIYENLIEREMI